LFRIFTGDWIRKTIDENIGNKPEDMAIREEARTTQPDFNFKFSQKTKLRLENDISTEPVDSVTSLPSSDSATPSVDKRFFEISLERPTGIEFATDLSLRCFL
jgi:hypothetical protein